jgi:tRNA-splicing ligase RtcB
MTNFHQIDDAVWNYVHGDKKIATVIANDHIIGSLENGCIQQLINASELPGLHEITLNPDAHQGYGVPVGSVLSSEDYLYMGSVGYDIKCSMSYLMLDLPTEELETLKQGRAVLDAITKRVGVGLGQDGMLPPLRDVEVVGVLFDGLTSAVARSFGIPEEWAERCEDASHKVPGLGDHVDKRLPDVSTKIRQLGSLGAGNHFCEVGTCRVQEGQEELAESWGLKDGCLGVLTHCGSRGLGHALAGKWFKELKVKFKQRKIPFIRGDKELVYLPADSPEGQEYLRDLAMAGNFTTVNHMVINKLVLEAFQEVFPGTKGELVYMISHNFVRKETCSDGKQRWVHRKGATRAMPGGHPDLRRTLWEDMGHPVLLPGHAISGSSIMVPKMGAKISQYSVNHGAGRVLGRAKAKKKLDQVVVDQEFKDKEILHNHRQFPLDEACAAYKDYDQVLDSVKQALLADEVAKLEARLLLK